MIIIFLGPPYSGKGTQAKLLSQKLNLPCFSMGELIRQENKAGNPKAVEAYQNFIIKGKHAPNSLKFGLLKEKMDKNKDNGFILDNYPAMQEDLGTFLNYLSENNLRVGKVFHIDISAEETKKRITARGREDDKPEVILTRREVQGKQRISVLDYFKNLGILVEINGEKKVEEVQEEITRELS